MVPVLLSVTAALLTAIAVGSTAIHLGDTAHDLARALARGVPETEVVDSAQKAAPNAHFALSGDSDLVEVTATQEINVPLPLFDRFSFTIEREATVPRESA